MSPVAIIHRAAPPRDAATACCSRSLIWRVYTAGARVRDPFQLIGSGSRSLSDAKHDQTPDVEVETKILALRPRRNVLVLETETTTETTVLVSSYGLEPSTFPVSIIHPPRRHSTVVAGCCS